MRGAAHARPQQLVARSPQLARRPAYGEFCKIWVLCCLACCLALDLFSHVASHWVYFRMLPRIGFALVGISKHIYTPPMSHKCQTHFIPWRRSVDDGVRGRGYLGSKSIAVQPLCMQHRGRVRMLRIACRQSRPSGVAFWEGVGGSRSSTSGGSRQKQQRGTTRGPAESSTSGGSSRGPAESSTSGGSSSSPPPHPPAEAAGGVGGRWVDWGECNT